MKLLKTVLLPVLFAMMVIIPVAGALEDKIGVYKDGSWYLDWSGNGVYNAGEAYSFGSPGWLSVVGDWNGDGKTKIGTYQNGVWYLDWNGNGVWDAGTDKVYNFGSTGWTSVVGDWNGDAKTEIGIYQNGVWYLDWNGNGAWNAGTDKVYNFGSTGWTSVVGDWNGDAKTEIGIYQNGVWYLDYNGNGAWNAGIDKVYNFGTTGWTPVVGNWNGDTTGTKIGIYKDGAWYLDYNGNGAWNAGIDKAYSFGATGWTPVVGKWTAPAPALNVLAVKPGDPDYTSDAILNTAVVQRAMNYNPTNIDGYALNVRETIKSLLLNDRILLINGHSEPGKIEVNKQNNEVYYGKKLLPGEYEFNEISSYANMSLAIFLGCNSGGSDFFHGNLVDVIGDKNGHCAMGWTKELNIVMAPYYNTQLWNQLQQSNTILNSHYSAIWVVANDGYCQLLHQNNPNRYNMYCNQDALYFRQNNQGCDLPLPSGMASQLSSIPSQTTDGERPSDTIIEKSIESIHQFTNSPVMDVRYSGTIHETYGDLYAFDADYSSYWVNSINHRVQSGIWFEAGSKDQKEIINLDQGHTIAESFTREKYPEFWNTSDTRGTKVVTKNIIDRGGDRQLQYEWWEIYYTSNKNTTLHSEIPGLNSVSVTVNPYTGHVIGYSEIYTPSVITGIPPVYLSPTLTNEQAQKIAQDHFPTLGVPDTQLTGPEPLGLRISTDHNNTAHLVWNFEMTKTQKIGPKDQEFEVKEYALVSVDAHDGTVVWSAPFG